ncbi:MAG: helix-turn-helix domain-containing protein [Candidatus Nanoarchaeia archaeon]|nr:helix-turn-helix domain-containing protein [Candidatus Nanoarchaeia archaeon]MDD5587770.1 helix-turn-helix domain-containing protein [Candidatus Nanoarchaeia archaeon]
MNLDILKKLGLSEGEIKVYNSLLEIGATSINKIHEKVGIDRRNIYDILNKLIERGLISYIEIGGKKTFNISNPNKIISYIEEKKLSLDEIKNEISKAIPQMQEIFRSEKQEMFAEIFKGAEGVKAVWEDLLNYDSIYWIGSGGYIPEKYPAFFKDWNKRRIKKKVKSYHLYRYEKWYITSKSWFTGAKILPKEFSGNPTVTVIYGDKVGQMLLGENVSVFIIKSKELAENYKKYFKYLWENIAKNH